MFLAVMNVIWEFTVAATDNSNFQSLLSPPKKAFMDHLFFMNPSFPQTQTLLDGASKALS